MLRRWRASELKEVMRETVTLEEEPRTGEGGRGGDVEMRLWSNMGDEGSQSGVKGGVPQ